MEYNDIRYCLPSWLTGNASLSGFHPVKLLFDQNPSHRLVIALKDEFPDSQHVREVGLKEASDEAVWLYAARHGFAIVTKDADFHQRSFLFGHPPKGIWIRRGNCSTPEIKAILRTHHNDIKGPGLDEQGTFLALDSVQLFWWESSRDTEGTWGRM